MKPNPARQSKDRQELIGLLQRLQQLAGPILGRCALLPGSLYQRQYRCGKAGCHCARGEPHRRLVLAIRRQGRSQVLSVPDSDRARIGPAVAQYRQFRRARAHMIRTVEQILRVADRLGRSRQVDCKQLGRGRA